MTYMACMQPNPCGCQPPSENRQLQVYSHVLMQARIAELEAALKDIVDPKHVTFTGYFPSFAETAALRIFDLQAIARAALEQQL